MTRCLITSCHRRPATVGLCAAHYKRYSRGIRGAALHASIAKRRKAEDVAREIRRKTVDNGHAAQYVGLAAGIGPAISGGSMSETELKARMLEMLKVYANSGDSAQKALIQIGRMLESALQMSVQPDGSLLPVRVRMFV